MLKNRQKDNFKQATAVLCEIDNLRASLASSFPSPGLCPQQFLLGQLDKGISYLMEAQEILIQGFEILML